MHRKIRAVLSLLFVLLLISAPSFSAYAGDYKTSANIDLKNELASKSAIDQNEEFTFYIEGIDDAPMPDNIMIKVKGTSVGCFGPITYTSPGLYEYKVIPIPGTNKNIEYDTRQYKVTVLVINNGGNPANGMSAEVTSVVDSEGDKVSEGLLFANLASHAASTSPDTGVKINGLMLGLSAVELIVISVFFIKNFLKRKGME